MKRFNWRWLVYLLLAVLVYFAVDYFVAYISDTRARLREAERTIAEQRKQIEETLTQVKELEIMNSILKGKEAELLGKISGLDKVIESQKKVIAELEASRPDTPPGCEEVVAHYLLEIDLWKTQFSLAEKKIAQYEELVGNLRLQLANKDKEIDLLRAQVERDNLILAGQQEFMKELRRALSLKEGQKLFTYAGTGLVIGLLVFTLISK